MREFPIISAVLVSGVCLLIPPAANGQDAGTTVPAIPTADAGSPPLTPTQPALPAVDPALPPTETSPETAPPWTWQHQTQNREGTVTGQHERTASQDGNSYTYQHSVAKPSGSHTQLREYSQTEEGYRYLKEHRFYQPDGTLLRQNGTSVTGTDPYNYQRQMTHTFRDGRTMEKTFTRSYDGTTGTMERSFLGPNGQVQQFQRPWTPDDRVEVGDRNGNPVGVQPPQEALRPTGEQPDTSSPRMVDPSVTEKPAGEGSLLSWLNPFKKHDTKGAASPSESGRRSGFTIGSFGRGRDMDGVPPGQTRKGSGSINSSSTHSMKAKTKQTGPTARVTSPPGKGTKTR